MEERLDAVIDLADRRYGKNDQDAEALFYLAQAHMLRATYRFEHDKGMWGAARDGARSKRLADAYIKRHPEHGDAYFALGAYNYYVEIAPAFKVLNDASVAVRAQRIRICWDTFGDKRFDFLNEPGCKMLFRSLIDALVERGPWRIQNH